MGRTPDSNITSVEKGPGERRRRIEKDNDTTSHQKRAWDFRSKKVNKKRAKDSRQKGEFGSVGLK